MNFGWLRRHGAWLFPVWVAAGIPESQAGVMIPQGVYVGGSVSFGGVYYYPGYAPYGVYAAPPRYSFVDTDVHPEDAQVFLDGKLVGVADDYDGYPGYLAIRPGKHRLGFSYQGYRSTEIRVDLARGELVRIDRKLPKLAKGETDPGLPAPAAALAGRGGSAGASTHALQKDSPEGALRLHVTPADAKIKLDGDFFGNGGDLSRLHSGIALAPGKHTIQVSLPGYRNESLEVDLPPGKEKTVSIDLEPL